MEKFPGSDKIKKIVKIAGLTALSVLPKENAEAPELHFNKPNFDFANREIYEDFRNQKLMPQYYGVSIDTNLSLEEEAKKIKKIEEDIKNKEQNIKKLISLYDQGRQWVLDNINNPEFIKKFTESEQKSFIDSRGEFTKDFIKEKLYFMNEQAYDPDYVVSDDINKSYGVEGSYSTEVGAFYHRGNGTVYFPNELDSTNAVSYAIHEYFHKVNEAGISLESIKLFSQAFDSLSVVKNLVSQYSFRDTLEAVKHFSSPTEMYSRKKQFEHDMEKFHVWKYGDKFTFQNYLRAIELKKADKLHFSSNDFIFLIKPDHFIKVMNEIP